MVDIELKLRASGISRIAGVDEAGRGPCAGPLVVAAVILPDQEIPSLARVQDSKLLNEPVREELFDAIIQCALTYSIVEISPHEIDRFGLHKSNLEGMRRAIQLLKVAPDYVLTDGYAIAGLSAPSLGVWKGDQISQSISAASILAKVFRDRAMVTLDLEYPGYGFAEHKGYITSRHSAAIRDLGITPIHRRSFSNIAKLFN